MFTIYSSYCLGLAENCHYTKPYEVSNTASLAEAVSHDYVCAKYKNFYRSNENFLQADCLPVDCDNDHSEEPQDWILPQNVMHAFPDVSFAVHYSRNNMKEKNGKAARPRFHVLFAIDPVTDAKEYTALKQKLNSYYPYFDDNALDAARFFFGTYNPKVEVYAGSKTLTEFLEDGKDFDDGMEAGSYGDSPIKEGKRNSTMSHYAGRILKRFGDTQEAYKNYLNMAKRCDPPLDDHELSVIWKSARNFYKKIAGRKDYIPPEEYNKLYELRPDDNSDIGEAKIFAREYGNELAYTGSTDYMRYDGSCWQTDSKQMAVGACEDFLDRQLEEANAAIEKMKNRLKRGGVNENDINVGGKTLEKKIGVENWNVFLDYQEALAFKKFVMKHRDMKYITSTMQAARPLLLKDINDFDQAEFLLNTPKATYDLRKGLNGARDHDPSDLITKVTSVSPNDKNKDLWTNALNNFFCNDEDLIKYVQQTVGLAVIGNVYQEALIIAYGSGGNGKSTFWNSITSVLGSYSGAISADALTIYGKRNARAEMAELKGKRLAIAAELEEGMQLSTSVVKQICSTDEIEAERKYKDPFKFKPTHVIVLYTNHLPRVGALDDGIWRRLIVIPFNAKMTGKTDIKNYSDYLVNNAGGAILSWIIEGAKQAIDNNFILEEPQVVKNAVLQYREDNNWIKHFIEECCEVDESYSQKSGELYQSYRIYSARVGDPARSTSDFYTGLKNAGFSRKKNKKGSFIYGMRLKPEELEF